VTFRDDCSVRLGVQLKVHRDIHQHDPVRHHPVEEFREGSSSENNVPTADAGAILFFFSIPAPGRRYQQPPGRRSLRRPPRPRR
jgi:hypothetical protein